MKRIIALQRGINATYICCRHIFTRGRDIQLNPQIILSTPQQNSLTPILHPGLKICYSKPENYANSVMWPNHIYRPNMFIFHLRSRVLQSLSHQDVVTTITYSITTQTSLTKLQHMFSNKS